ncbi:MAG: ABC transporter ATP-binding protein [Bacillota bacterium]
MPLIQIKNAAFAYDENDIFSGIDLSLERGQLCCLMGANGCGKSTLLDCILGINELGEGELIVDGKSIMTYKPHLLARKMSYVPQVHDRSFPYKVFQIVLMGRTSYLNRFGSPRKNDIEATQEALRSIGIEHLADRPYTQISGGEMQLVMLARALVQEAPIIIMDEPTAHLDFKNELLFMETVVNLIKEQGVSVLMATHSPNQAFYFENQGIDVKIAIMHNKRIFATGKPSSILLEENIKELYQIDSKIICHTDRDFGEVRQIVPLQTLKN